MGTAPDRPLHQDLTLKTFSNLGTIPADVRSSGFRFEQLRNDPDIAANLFAVQVANGNRPEQLRRLRDETRHLRSPLEAEPAVRP